MLSSVSCLQAGNFEDYTVINSSVYDIRGRAPLNCAEGKISQSCEFSIMLDTFCKDSFTQIKNVYISQLFYTYESSYTK
jgi:hypothetical protein